MTFTVAQLELLETNEANKCYRTHLCPMKLISKYFSPLSAFILFLYLVIFMHVTCVQFCCVDTLLLNVSTGVRKREYGLPLCRTLAFGD
jgi:hypothetical protein